MASKSGQLNNAPLSGEAKCLSLVRQAGINETVARRVTLATLLVQSWLEHADIREAAVMLIVVEAVAHNELIRALRRMSNGLAMCRSLTCARGEVRRGRGLTWKQQ